ncbi:DNA repair protein XRCC1 isoform X1 [Octopus sinensis]|uniref:DNA repair protein XRCC1 n=2 Tax=Octopus sinensis TaxID=2607531 RepID=A0A6P7TC13_9MOLL|nr:DNA repair protein XRCC1 isoform X1 [Octopus sinensis]
MPEIKLQHIVSYSSQDTNHPAENLLKPDGVHKWKSASAGEKSLSAILQFEKASKIHSIDIGNDGSAFIEVLVGRSSSHNEDFKVILVTSSFMSPMESRNNTNRFSVRMFGSEKLSKPATEEKWDRVKIICTQPFNKTTNYGLSFIKFHSPPSSENRSRATVSTVDNEEDDLNNPKKIGAFFFRQDEEDKKDLKVGSLFARQKEKPESSPLTGAAAIRAASNQARSTYLEIRSSTNTNSTPEVKKKRKHNVSDDEDVLEVKKSKSKNGDSHRSHMPQNDRPTHQKEDSRKEKQADIIKKEKKSNSSSRDDVKSTPSSSSSNNSHKNSHHKSETTTSKAAISKSNKPFSKLMDNVVFVLSGFQNPFRADLRDKAREMGAKYRPDWSSDCTHLVCAFANTPKYNMVKGQGRIVTKQWVLDCHKQRTLLPWRKYQLEDEEEEDEKADKVQVKDEGKKQKKEKEKKDDEEEEEEEEEQQTQVIDEEEDYSQQSRLSKSKSDPEYLPSMEDRESTDEEEGVVSEEDTDDEVRRIKNAANIQSESSSSSDAGPSSFISHAADTLEINSNDDDDDDDDNDHDKNNRNSDDDDDAFDAATDVDEDKNSDSDSELPILPDFFSDKHFFLYGNFNESDRHELTRYIIAYNGEVEDYMNDDVNFVVTSEQWDDNFDEALSNHPQLTFVHPKWLYSCHKKNKLVPYQLHIVTPASE